MNTFYEYPKCTTCKKAKKWLLDNNIDFNDVDITKDTPTKEQLIEYHKKSNKDIKTFFNTSGNVYKELNLKDKLSTMSDDEKFILLSSNGMLIKRPLIVTEHTVLIGFKEVEWQENL